MNRVKTIFLVTSLFVVGFVSNAVAGDDMLEAAPGVKAAVLYKVLGFENKIAGEGNQVSVYAVGSNDFAEELKKGVGKNVGKGVLASVEVGTGLPANPPSVIFVEDEAMVDQVVKYAQEKQILSATGKSSFIAKGVTVGVGVGEDGRPRIVLNLSSSKKEGLDWNPAVLKSAVTK